MGSIRGFIVVPAYNEAAGLPSFVSGLSQAVTSIAIDHVTVDFTVILVNDGSTDATSTVAERLAVAHSGRSFRVRHLDLLRNFGHQAALIAGMLEAASSGADFVVTMDADGEHPAALLGPLISQWLAGDSIVHTMRRPHPQLSRIKRWTSIMYYWLLQRAAGLPIRSGMADFKLWDGALLKQLQAALPHCGSTRAFAVWLAPSTSVIGYDQFLAKERISRFTSRKMWSLALGGVVRYSDVPLRLSILVGALALSFAIGLTAFVVWATVTGRTVPGWASIILTVSTFGGFQSFAIGILGEYLLRNWFRQSLPQFVLKPRRTTMGD